MDVSVLTGFKSQINNPELEHDVSIPIFFFLECHSISGNEERVHYITEEGPYMLRRNMNEIPF
jgi:hypothetical protein